jgi:Protein kinase domain/Galactose oxidase, central domain
MDAPQYQHVKEIVASLIELEPSVRARQLTRLCEGDEELRREVESLLAANDEADDFLDEPAYAYANTTAEMVGDVSPPAGWRIGPYCVVREIGSGGMGVVYEAVRDDEFRKRVAIKVVKPGMDTAFILRRFRSERRICAALSHPNIAMLLDGGSTADQRPYFAMEYVEGEPIDSYCNRRSLSVRQRLELFGAVCAAVHHAHQNLVVHRDLKPSNILVTKEGVPKLLDFGIAKILGPSDFGRTAGITELMPVMTPEYASPEQALGESVTTAADLYSLGAVLYEILTGKRAHRFHTGTAEEIRQVICEQEPVAPSEASGNRELRGDLDNVIRKAMHRDPLRRYSSAEEMSGDLALFLCGRPVRARKDTLRYRSGKFILRHRGAVTATALIVLSLIGGILATAWEARIAARERAKPERRFNPLFPPVRCCMGMASVAPGGSARPKAMPGALLFGGFDGSSPYVFGDTWMLQEGEWLQLDPANAPTPRGGAGMAYDAATGTFVLFGGQLGEKGGRALTNRAHSNDTWIWDGKTWTQVFPPISPPARRFDGQGMAYDPRTGTVVLFGGITPVRNVDTVLGDTWTWNGKTRTWTRRPVTGPSPRRAPIAYDDARGTVILFGGDDGKKAFSDTWEWTGSSWLPRFPAASPPPRAMPSMAYDAAIHRVVLFGGFRYPGSSCPDNDAWTWNGVTWKEHFPTNVPSGRWAAGMVYDPIFHGEVIFGGFGCGNTLGDTRLLRFAP